MTTRKFYLKGLEINSYFLKSFYNLFNKWNSLLVVVGLWVDLRDHNLLYLLVLLYKLEFWTNAICLNYLAVLVTRSLLGLLVLLTDILSVRNNFLLIPPTVYTVFRFGDFPWFVDSRAPIYVHYPIIRHICKEKIYLVKLEVKQLNNHIAQSFSNLSVGNKELIPVSSGWCPEMRIVNRTVWPAVRRTTLLAN